MICVGVESNPQAISLSYNLELVAEAAGERFVEKVLSEKEWNRFSLSDVLAINPERLERIFFSSSPLLQFSFDEWRYMKEHFIVGAYFADSNQYFVDWYRYLLPFLDFAIVGEYEEQYWFKPYCDNIIWNPWFCLTNSEEFDGLDRHEIHSEEGVVSSGIVHIGRISHRSGREPLRDKLSNSVKCYGPDSTFLEVGEFNATLRHYKFGLVATSGGVSTKFGADKFLSNYRQSKGKVWDYIYNGLIPISEYSPTLAALLPCSYIQIDSVSKFLGSLSTLNNVLDDSVIDKKALEKFVMKYSKQKMIEDTEMKFVRSCNHIKVGMTQWSFVIASMGAIQDPIMFIRNLRFLRGCSLGGAILVLVFFAPLGWVRIIRRAYWLK